MFDSRKGPKRWFVPPNEDLWDRQLPPEWNAWLRMGRKDPPTDEEIEHNLSVQRQKQLFDQKTKEDNKQIESNPYSSFPRYPEYEEKDK